MGLNVRSVFTKFFATASSQEQSMYRATLWLKISHFVKLDTQDGFAIAKKLLMTPILRTGVHRRFWQKINTLFQSVQGDKPSDRQREEILCLVGRRLEALHSPKYTDLFETDEFR